MKKVVAVVQARMGSYRLPGKVLKKVLGKPLLEYLLERLQRVSLLDDLIVATTTSIIDDSIEKLCKERNISCFRGSEDNVLSRYRNASLMAKADYVVRICADSPLLDPVLVDEFIYEIVNNHDQCDYLSNTINQTYPLGMNVEIFTYKVLDIAFRTATSSYDKEHVTPFIYNNPSRFLIQQKHMNRKYSGLRLTVDEQEDFILIKRVIEELYPSNPNFGLLDIFDLYYKNKNIFLINSKVRQNALR